MNILNAMTVSLVLISSAFSAHAAAGNAVSARKPASNQTGWQCTDRAGGPDNGYLVYISSKRNRADVQEQSIAGPHTIATLVCKVPNVAPKPGNDRINTVLTCAEPNIRDAGYSLRIETGGIAGLTTATLSEVTLAGANDVATLSCKQAQ